MGALRHLYGAGNTRYGKRQLLVTQEHDIRFKRWIHAGEQIMRAAAASQGEAQDAAQWQYKGSVSSAHGKIAEASGTRSSRGSQIEDDFSMAHDGGTDDSPSSLIIEDGRTHVARRARSKA